MKGNKEYILEANGTSDEEQTNISSEDLDADTIQQAVDSIVSKRISYYNTLLVKMYRIASSFLRTDTKLSFFPIFERITTDSADGGAEDSDKNESLHTFLKQAVTLQEEEEHDSNSSSIVEYKLILAGKGKEWPAGKARNELIKLETELSPDKNLRNMPYFYRFCELVNILLSKYSSLASNITGVHDNVDLSSVQITNKPYNIVLSNAVLNLLYKVITKSKNGAQIKTSRTILLILNQFTTKSISKIMSADTLPAMLKLLPMKLMNDNYMKLGNNTKEFTITFDKDNKQLNAFLGGSTKISTNWISAPKAH